MRLRRLVLAGVTIVALFVAPALADINYTQVGTTVIFSFTCFTSKVCPAHVLIDSTGTEKATSGNPLRTDPTGTTTQPVSATSLPLPSGAATQTTLASILSALGSPFQAGGSVTANLGTLNGASTAANQTTGNGSLATIATNSGSQATAANQTTGNTSAAASAAALGTTADTPCAAPASATTCTVAALLKAIVNTGQYPAGAVAITASTTGTTGATTATLAATSGKTTYLCTLSIRSNATVAATGNATVTGPVTGTMNYTHWTAPLASGVGSTQQEFNPCVPASATNTGIAVISPAPGSGGTVSVTATGYQL